MGVGPICRTLDVSASAYYKRATGERSELAIDDERLLLVIRELHEANYFAYGSRRMWKALLRAGEQVDRGRVERLMRQERIQSATRRGKPWRTTTRDPKAQRRPDLVRHDFAATRPDELWFADFTYLRCRDGRVFFSFVIDAYSRRVVGWQFAAHMRTDLVLDALRMALAHRSSVPHLGKEETTKHSLREARDGSALSCGRGPSSATTSPMAHPGRLKRVDIHFDGRGRW